MKRILIMFISVIAIANLYGQHVSSDSLKRFGVGVAVSSLSRLTTVKSQYPSIGGSGFEVGLRIRFWRLGLFGGYGYTVMQTPNEVNLSSNRMQIWGGELELRFGPRQRWLGLFGMHGHYYDYLSKTTEIVPGVVVESLNNEITQQARCLGIGYQFHNFFRVSLYYQWEGVDQQYTERRPSCQYVLARLSFIFDSNGLANHKLWQE